MKLTLTSPRDRNSALISIQLPEDGPDAEWLELWPESGGKPLVAERDLGGTSISVVVPPMKANEPAIFEVKPSEETRAPGITVAEKADTLDVTLRGSPFLSLHHGKEYPKPVINPILTPGGTNMLREMMPAYGEGEHPWQRGLTLMQGAINGVDCWNEGKGPNFGHTVQDNLGLSHGPLSLVIASFNTWYNEKKPLMTDRRQYRLFDTGRDAVVLDIRLAILAAYGDLTIGGTKEAGFLCIRVNPTMNADKDGHMENCYGATDEGGCWSKPAHWVDYWGPVGDEVAGFGIFDHPENFRYPTTWHVRGYGLFAPNCWMFKADHRLKADEVMTFQWRVIIHTGDTRQAQIRERFLDYVDGPRAKWNSG